MNTSEKVREDRVRRMLARQGYQLTKSGRRDHRAWDYGKYILTQMLVSGADSGRIARYFDSLDEAEGWALKGDREGDPKVASAWPVENWEEIGTIEVGANWAARLGSSSGDGPHHVRVLRHKDQRIRFIRLDPKE